MNSLTLKNGIRLVFCLTIIGFYSFLCSKDTKTERITVELTDTATGESIPGLIRIISTQNDTIGVGELVAQEKGWHAVIGPTTISIPRERVYIEAISGLETELTVQKVDLSVENRDEITIPLKRFYDASETSYYSGNTHLHLRGFTREESDRYLREVSGANGLDMVFVSYLERADDDKSYITNIYNPVELQNLSGNGVMFWHGEEHRHNFGAYDEGFGHVMLLNTKKLIQPVSIGPGITKAGSDGIPMARGLTTARQDGATTLWCHNSMGFEDIPNWLMNRLDAQNIFDGGSHESYEDSYYRYLNIGLKVPFSTGTDWFIFDLSRAYIRLNNTLTAEDWLDGLAEGKTYITNGPFLEFQIDGKTMGEILELKRPGKVEISGKGIGRADFGGLELIYNGEVVHSVLSAPEEKHYTAQMDHSLEIKEPGWLALRIAAKDNRNEFDRILFGHTSAVYVNVAGKTIFKLDVAEGLLEEMQNDIITIEEKALFHNNGEKEAVLSVYEEAKASLLERMKK